MQEPAGKRREGRFLLGFCLMPLLGIGGCVSVGDLPENPPVMGMAPAELPQPTLGDQSYYTGGRSERVTAVEGQTVSWYRSGGKHFQGSADFTLPEELQESSTKRVSNELIGDPNSIWPVNLGKNVKFSVKRVSTRKSSGVSGDPAERFWRCEVNSSESLSVAAGDFDVYRIDCTRSAANTRFRQRVVWYYAPSIEKPVLRLNFRRYGKKNRLELMAFDPALPGLSQQDQQRFQQRFQQAMEKTPSGETVNWSKGAGKQIAITPIKTLSWRDGTFCRNYRTQVKLGSYARQGAGLVCRTETGEWKVPAKISNKRGVRF